MQFDLLVEFSKKIISNINLDMHKLQFVNTGPIKKPVSAWQLIFKNLRHQRKISYATQCLLDVAKSQGTYEINESEK
jgi:hypothetical protein